ncbi:MAG: hypothetical protein NTX22_04615 [Ignavibacteriales bacterium]|nr:hypothetical protein [Ignavibacteriales bacterium]
MDLIKQYIVQCIVSAANNLRLSTEKIEVVALLREEITHAEDLENLIQEMKKVTELSTFAIKLGEVFTYLAMGKIDFLKLSDKFKEHGSYIAREFSNLLDKISPQIYRQISFSMKEHMLTSKLSVTMSETVTEKKGIVLEEIHEIKSSELFIKEKESAQPDSDKLKEEFILELEEKSDDILFEKFEERILTPIKAIDQFLKELSPEKINYDELEKFYKLMEKNAEISSKIGFEIIASMHSIFAKALLLIKSQSLQPVKEVLEGMRACLIVIVAVVRGKEVDITNYLNRAEKFGKQIQDIN